MTRFRPKIRRVAKLYLYMRLGYSNYLSTFISIINFSLIIWNFTNLKHIVNYWTFLALFVIFYLPIAYVLGSIDLRKGLSKIQREINPFWVRPTLIERKTYVGSLVALFTIPMLSCTLKLEKSCKCLKESLKDTIEYLASYGEKMPSTECVCNALREEGIIDDERFKKCIEVSQE